jgi:predicted DNA-binding transcriptional regulator AlpA
MTPSPRLKPVVGDPDRLRLADPPSLAGSIEPLLSIADLCRILGIDRRTFERMRAAGRVPAPSLLVGTRSPRWARATIRNWIGEGRHG